MNTGHWLQKEITARVQKPNWVRNPIDSFVLSKMEEKFHPIRKRISQPWSSVYGPHQSAHFSWGWALCLWSLRRCLWKGGGSFISKSTLWRRMALEYGCRTLCRQQWLPTGRRHLQWIWRDWVVQALNQDMPFVSSRSGNWLVICYPMHTDQKIASGFNRNHLNNGEGVPWGGAAFLILFDRIDVTSLPGSDWPWLVPSATITNTIPSPCRITMVWWMHLIRSQVAKGGSLPGFV